MTKGADREKLRDRWENPGLLIEKAALEEAEAMSECMFFAFDWEDFRTDWKARDEKVRTQKLTLQRTGVVATVALGLGAICLAWSEPTNNEWLVWAGAVCAVTAVLVALAHLFLHKRRRGWLNERLFVERLRHVYHQLILDELPAIIAAERNPKMQQSFEARRTERLEASKRTLHLNIVDGWASVKVDEKAEQALIFLPSGETERDYLGKRVGALMANPLAAELVLDQVGRQRFGAQKRYCLTQLNDDVRSMKFWQQFAHVVFVVCIVLAPIMALLAAFQFGAAESSTSSTLIALSASATAIGLSSRVVEGGLGFRKDLRRFNAYLARTLNACREFEAARSLGATEEGFQNALKAWLALEKAAYLEMRQFLQHHKGDHFFS